MAILPIVSGSVYCRFESGVWHTVKNILFISFLEYTDLEIAEPSGEATCIQY